MVRYMPPEWAPQERLWLAWPTSGYTLGETETEIAEAYGTWAAVANAASEFQKVAMVVDPSGFPSAKKYLSGSVELFEAPLNDAWMRDIGPTFVVEDGALAATCWVFNGWGAQAWAEWDKDSKIGAFVAEIAGAKIFQSDLVNEGGGIHVDGKGAVLLTDTVQRDPGRNPGATRIEVEQKIHAGLGTERAYWFKRGLTRDSEEFGTRGHIDICVTFAPTGQILVHDQLDTGHPDFEVSRELLDTASEIAKDTGAVVTSLPAPKVLKDTEGFVDYSYVNHVVINDAVIASTFDDPNDDMAIGVLQDAYPGRKIVGIDSRPLFARGGGIHCITQQQPKLSN